jgi:hypothetical protein
MACRDPVSEGVPIASTIAARRELGSIPRATVRGPAVLVGLAALVALVVLLVLAAGLSSISAISIGAASTAVTGATLCRE